MKRTNEFDRLYKKEVNDFPTILDLELTNYCNLDCNMCARQLMRRPCGYMDRYTLNKILKETKGKDLGIRFIRWGEPFLHKYVLKFIEKVKKQHPLHITTNGLKLNDNRINKIVELEVDSIIFSMQGLTKEKYIDMRGDSITSWDRLYDNVNKLIEARGDKKKPFIHITTTKNYGETEEKEFRETWKDIVGVDKVSIGNTSWERFSIEYEHINYLPCKEIDYKLSIDWNGKVTACCGDYDNLLTVGNVHNQDLYEMWNHNNTLESIRYLIRSNNHRLLTLCSKCYPAYGEL